MRAQLQYRLPQTPELLTICLAIVCVSFSPSSLFPFSRCLYLSWTRRCREYWAEGGGGWLSEVPVTCLARGDRMSPSRRCRAPRELRLGAEKRRSTARGVRDTSRTDSTA